MTLEQMKERRSAIFATEIDAAKTDAELDVLQTEIRKLDLQIANEETRADGQSARTAAVNGAIPEMIAAQATPTQTRSAEDVHDSAEYRKAFAQFVTRGTPIAAEFRTNENTLTSDVATVIPPIYVNRIVEKMESIGMILPLVTRTSYAAGVNLPTSSVKPTATWVNEGATSDTQKKTTSYIQFSNFKLRCEISMSMEVGTMAMSAFEAAFVRQVSEAMVKAIEGKIISTDAGTTNPKGILAYTPASGQAITAKTLTYEKLVEAEAALPQAYETNAVWCMTKKTYLSFVGMVDANGQPIARTNYGISGAPERTLLGRPVILCGDYMTSFSAATTGTVFAFIFNFSDYLLNTVYDMGIQRKQDWDTEDYLTKAVMSCDGKVVDVNSLVTIAKAA